MTKKEFCDFFTNYYGEKVDNICQISNHSYTGTELYEFVSAALRQPAVIKSVCQCCGKRTIDYFNTKCKSCGTEHAYKQTVL